MRKLWIINTSLTTFFLSTNKEGTDEITNYTSAEYNDAVGSGRQRWA